MKKLLLCSGTRKSPLGNDGWYRVDGNPGYEPDLVATVPPIPRQVYNMKPWSMIAMIHGIEHFYSWDALELLVQCREIIEIGGQLILEQPNLERCILGWNSAASMKGIYGDQSWCDPSLAHRYGYTPKTLAELAIKAGFSKTAIEPAQFHNVPRDFRLVATA